MKQANPSKAFVRIVISIACACVFSVSAAAAKVREVVLSGGGELSQERIAALLGVRLGDEVTEAQLEEGLKRLANTGRYQSLQVHFDASLGRVSLDAKLYDVLDAIEFRIPGEEIPAALYALVNKDVNDVTALSPGDRISVDQVGEIRERVLQRLRDRGFKGVQVVIALEASELESERNLLVSAKLGIQERVAEIEFQGFRSGDLLRIRDSLEETTYIKPYLRKLDVPAESVDHPEDYLVKQFQRLRGADAGKATGYDIEFPLDWVLINATLNDIGQRMRAEGYFDFRLQAGVVDGKNSGTKLLVRLDRGPRYNVQFSGNVNFWERNLREKVLDRPMRLGLPLNLVEAQAQIRSMYLLEGFRDVKIELRTEDKGVQRRIEFQISEGRRSYFGKILWEGLLPREVELLSEIEAEWKAPMTSPLHHVYFDERGLRTQMPNLLSMIKASGFLQARILGFKVVPRAGTDRIDIEVPIQLGPRFILRDIVVEGQHPLSDEELNDIVDLEPGELAKSDDIIRVAERLRRAVQDRGFLFSQVPSAISEIVTYSDTSDEVDVKFIVDMGPQVRVGQIVVEGLRRSKERVVLREFDREKMNTGELWVPSKLEDIDQRLLAYGLFGNLRISGASDRVVKRASETEDGVEQQERDIRVSLTERPGGAIEFGPGYRTDLGIVGFGEYNYRNIGGMNRSVVIRTQVSHKIENYQFLGQKHSLNFLEPYIFDLPWAFRFGTAFEKRDEIQYDKDNIAIGGFNAEEISIAFGLGKEFNRHITLSHNLYSLSNPKISDLKGSASADEQVYRIGTMGPSLTFDYRDSIFNPSRGSVFSTAFEYSSPKLGSTESVHYILNKNEFSHYVPLRVGLVFASSFAYSHMQTLQGVPSLPIDRRLVLGGRTSVRSLQEKAIRYDQSSVAYQNSYLFKTELRQDLFNGLGFAYFLDMGRVDSRGFEGDGWREAIGIGIRYSTPVGPLALDFAFNADKRDREDFNRILFSVGVF